MTVRELIGNLILMPPDAKVYIDCTQEYPECAEITSCKQWKELEEEEHYNYGWSKPSEEDVFLN